MNYIYTHAHYSQSPLLDTLSDSITLSSFSLLAEVSILSHSFHMALQQGTLLYTLSLSMMSSVPLGKSSSAPNSFH